MNSPRLEFSFSIRTAAIGISCRALYSFATCVQVRPPSLVSKLLRLGDIPDGGVLRVQGVDAAQIIRNRGNELLPVFAAVRGQSSVPALPTIQQTFSEGAEPERRSAVTPLFCAFQDCPHRWSARFSPRGRRASHVFCPEQQWSCSLVSNKEESSRPINGRSREVTGAGGA